MDIGRREAATGLEQLRAGTNAAIIVVSSSSATVSVAQALTAGADDYVTAPVRPAELRARARAVVRRRRVHRSGGGRAGA